MNSAEHVPSTDDDSEPAEQAAADRDGSDVGEEDSPPGAGHALLPPMPNPYVVGIASAPVFDLSELDEVSDDLSNGGSSELLDQRLIAAVEQANSEYFRFELSTLHAEGEPALQRISTGLPDWGLSRDESTRKLIVVVPVGPLAELRDDATLVVPQLDRSEPLVPGSALMIPAYLYPEVRAGDAEIQVVVTHAYGRAFR